jgi:hypothetical protein
MPETPAPPRDTRKDLGLSDNQLAKLILEPPILQHNERDLTTLEAFCQIEQVMIVPPAGVRGGRVRIPEEN